MGNISNGKKMVLGLQHVLAMFGATVLVPFYTGLNPSIALLAAGIGTLIFHLVTGGKVPVFLGSSFAFITAIQVTLQHEGLGAVKGGVICAGIIYIIMGLIIKTFGVDKVRSFFPPIVTGPIIMVIGLRLSPIAIGNAFYKTLEDGAKVFEPTYVLIALSVVLTMIVISIFAKGFFKLVPILISVIVGYLLSIPFGLIDVPAIQGASFFLDKKMLEGIFTLPQFNLSGIIAITPIALVVFIEHIGDITTNGAVVGKDFFKDPGVHRTMMGDGFATIAAGLIGGPANTTYSENTGVLAVTKVYDPSILRIAAVFAIVLSFFGKVGAIIETIPLPVMGGVSIILFGMIASVGVRILINAELDFSHSRNLIIASVIMVLGIGISDIPLPLNLTLSGLAVAAFAGIFLNKILPQEI